MSVKLARSAGLISLATMASRLLGVAREMVLAALFGAGARPVSGMVPELIAPVPAAPDRGSGHLVR